MTGYLDNVQLLALMFIVNLANYDASKQSY